mmetsp:Transcript_23276/g.31078  ORF Transcript_23276/g.31078 Transcript_23276/m.31078 type:complete len:324 (+) Transcript_23276:370-1341(+)
MDGVNNKGAHLVLELRQVALLVLSGRDEVVNDAAHEWLLEEFLPQLNHFLPNERLQLVLGHLVKHGHFLDLATKGLGDNLAAEADTDQFDVGVVLIDVLDEAREDRQPGGALDVVNRGDCSRQNDGLHVGELGFRWQVEVKDVVDAPLLHIGASQAAHVLPNEHRFVQGFHVGAPVKVQHGHLWVEGHRQNLGLVDVDGVDDTVGHVHNQLHVEAGDKSAHEVSVQNLTQRDPVQRQILVLRPFKVFLEGHVYGLEAEEGHRKENGQMVLRDHFHLRGVAGVHKYLQDFFHLFVSEDIELVVLHQLVLHNPLYFTRKCQACQL